MSRAHHVLRRAAQAPVGRTLAPHVRRWVRPPEYRYVFVVTYGRSGSTLVQGLLNTLPRTLVRGENNFYVLPLYRSMASIRSFRRIHMKHNPRASHSAFFGLHEIEPESFVRSTHDLMTGHMLGSAGRREVDVLGFKEVLWHQIRPEETAGFFDFLDSAFPGARYVLNQRTHEHVASSGFWQKHDSQEVFAAIERVEEIQAFLRESRPDRVLDTRYELITSEDRAVSDAQLRGLAEFVVGTCDEELLGELRETLRTGHGPYAFGASHGRRKRPVGAERSDASPSDGG